MNRDIRLLALDLDGTTFNSKKIITNRTKNAIEAAIKKGVIVMPATGRPKSGLPESFISIPGVRYALTSNGGAVVDLINDTVIHSDFVDYEIACRVIDLMLPVDAMIEVYHNGHCYADRSGYEKMLYTYKNVFDWFRVYVKKSRIPVDNLRKLVYSGNLKIEKFLASFDDVSLRQPLFEQAKAMGNLSVVFGNEFNLEISSATANKGNCLLAFADRLGIRQDQIMACGDNMNDQTMMEAAGLAVAMGNADEDIKALADFVTLTNDEDGVAYAIEKFIL